MHSREVANANLRHLYSMWVVATERLAAASIDVDAGLALAKQLAADKPATYRDRMVILGAEGDLATSLFAAKLSDVCRANYAAAEMGDVADPFQDPEDDGSRPD